MNNNKFLKFHARVVFALIVLNIVFFSTSFAKEIQPGRKYRTIKVIHITGVYNELSDRRITKETATAYLAPKKYANKKSWYGFQKEVPAGTVITILRLLPKPWYLPFSEDEYQVNLDPDVSEGLDVVIEIARGFEGSLDGLNSEIFVRDAASK